MSQRFPSEIPATLDECMDAHYALHQAAETHNLPIALPVDAPTAGGRFGLDELPVLPERFEAVSILDVDGDFAQVVMGETMTAQQRAALGIGSCVALWCIDRPLHYVADPSPNDVSTLAAHDLQIPAITEPFFFTPEYQLRITASLPRKVKTSYRFVDGGIHANRVTSAGRISHASEYARPVLQEDALAITAFARALRKVPPDHLAGHAQRKVVRLRPTNPPVA